MRQYENNKYEQTLSAWTGYRVTIMDDFDSLCGCDYDFIELLMVFEKEYRIDLLESEKERQDFKKVKDFVEWAVSRPLSEEPNNGFKFLPLTMISKI